MTIRAERSARWLDVLIHDDGRGLPGGFSLEKSDRLGLQIVRTLVSAELDGSLGMHDVSTGGTDVVLRQSAIERLEPLVARVERALRGGEGRAALHVAAALVTVCATAVVEWSHDGRSRGTAADAVRRAAAALG